jgi:ribosome production factor 2
MALKRPNVISFSKKNVVHPFEDASSLEFWATKNDASFFVIAQSTKKRPNDLIFVRTFDGRVLDMCEVGVDSFVSMNDFKVRNVNFFPWDISLPMKNF